MSDMHRVRRNPNESLDDMSWADLFRLYCLVVYSCATAEIQSYLHRITRDKVHLHVKTLAEPIPRQW
jgi:hypothetical protein